MNALDNGAFFWRFIVLFNMLLNKYLSTKQDDKKTKNRNLKYLPFPIILMLLTLSICFLSENKNILFEDDEIFNATIIIITLFMLFVFYLMVRPSFVFNLMKNKLKKLHENITVVEKEFKNLLPEFDKVTKLDDKQWIEQLVDEGESIINTKEKRSDFYLTTVIIPLVIGFISNIDNPMSSAAFVAALVSIALYAVINFFLVLIQRADNPYEIKNLVYILKIIKRKY
jgi:hypothetical protein